MALDLLLDALSPDQLPAAEPGRAASGRSTPAGASLVKGARNFLDDLVNNGGKSAPGRHQRLRGRRQPGRTPGKVVFRNELMELLQYEPQTEQVHATPLLCSPPWINKYYVMDLAPGRSFIEWAVQHGRTVFAISYLNPSADMCGTTMDDYLVHGPQTALDVIQEITGAETIDIVGLCLGGALTAITAAYLTQAGDSRIGTLTLLNTMLDYAEPGALGDVHRPSAPWRSSSKKMRKAGTLEGASMAGTFDILRANDLIFNYVVSQLADGPGPAGVRHPGLERRQHPDAGRDARVLPAQLLRREQAGRGQLEIAGPHDRPERDQVADLRGQRDQRPHRAVGVGLQDRRPGQRPGPVRARQRRAHRRHRQPARARRPGTWSHDEDDRRAGDGGGVAGDRAAHAGTWWEDWARWSSESAGDWSTRRALGSARHPVLGDAPGRYVHT